MEPVTFKHYIGEIIQSLAPGPPYWPEIGMAIAIVTLCLWLVLRLQRHKEAQSKETE